MINHNIRKAIKEDVSDILRLVIELAVFEKEPDSVKITEEELIKDGFGDKPRYECFLAEVENEIVGLAFFTERYSTWVGDTLQLEDLIVNIVVKADSGNINFSIQAGNIVQVYRG